MKTNTAVQLDLFEDQPTQVSNHNSMFAKIKGMHTKFGITNSDMPTFTQEEKTFRIMAMLEEVEEYACAETIDDELDAIIDLIVFALGTLERQGLFPVAEEAFNRVMMANCNKELGSNTKRGSFSLDLVKPKRWTAPQFRDLLEGIGK
jgi:predicted HAD superfamily Cof-like phosphohydrolase